MCSLHQTASYFIRTYTYPDTATPFAVTRNSPRALAKCYMIQCHNAVPLRTMHLLYTNFRKKKKPRENPSLLIREAGLKASQVLHVSHGFQEKRKQLQNAQLPAR